VNADDILVLKQIGPLAIVRNGDRICLSVSARTVELALDQHEIDARLAAFSPARCRSGFERGVESSRMSRSRRCSKSSSSMSRRLNWKRKYQRKGR
jgi:dihydroxyacid dehydratase/phosphogluconate dehydratase